MTPPKTRQDYEHEMLMLRDAIRDDPANVDEYQNKLNYRVSKWIDLSDVLVFRANNEQTPWTEQEIGFTVVPMPTKQECSFDQVADYQYAIDCQLPYEKCFGPLVVERKSKQDLYGTLFGNRDRFYREIERFERDPRFDQMIIIVESNFTEWLNYNPSPESAGIPQKLASIASLQARNIPVYFAGSACLAAKLYQHCVRQNIMKNWERWVC